MAICLLAFPLVLAKYGFKVTLAIGLIGWVARNLLFATGWLPIIGAIGLPLHGLCFVFFFMVTKLEEVGATALGYQPEGMPMYPCKLFVGYQAIGAYLVLVIAMLWAARPHLARVWRAATSSLSSCRLCPTRSRPSRN